MKNDFLVEMGKRLAERWKQLKMTQEKLAEKIDVSLQTISNIELGKKAVRPDNLAKLCSELGITSDYILYGKRSEEQLNTLTSQIASLSPADYKIISDMVNRLKNK